MAEQVDQVPTSTEQAENEGEYWAGRVQSNLKEREQEVTKKGALETLAVLDAEHSITDRMDGEDMDAFLDEFEASVGKADENAEAIQKRIKGDEEPSGEE